MCLTLQNKLSLQICKKTITLKVNLFISSCAISQFKYLLPFDTDQTVFKISVTFVKKNIHCSIAKCNYV